MKHNTRNIYLNGTSAYDLHLQDSPYNNPISIEFNTNERDHYKNLNIKNFFNDLKESFVTFLCEGKLNNGLHYCNFSGKDFNRMTRIEAICTGALLMSIAVATVFFGM